VLLSAAQPIWSLPLPEVYPALLSTPEGLSSTEAAARLERFGANRLPPLKRRPLLLRFTDQLFHFMALLLWVAGTLAFIARAPQLGWAIWAVILINGVFSFWQEFKAERTLQALAGNLPPMARVWRDGHLQEITADQLVCGDRVALEEGDQVPADCRVVEAHQLYVDLSVLTGESLPVARDPEPQQREGVPTRERTNLLLAGTTVATGRGEGLVYAIASETEFGQVAHLTATTARSTSTLEVQIQRIVHTITVIALGTGLFTFAISVLVERMAPVESLIYAVGIIVGFVPEGLLPQVTLTLALNVQRMAKRNALVRRLSAVETLGSVSVICSDKTGTITQNRMAVEDTWLPAPGEARHQLLLLAASLCSNARLEHDTTGPEPWRASGDPTETALLMAAAEAGLIHGEQQRRFPRRRELPFDSHRRRMTVVIERGDAIPGLPQAQGEQLAITKGAPLEVLRLCNGHLTSAGIAPLSPEMRHQAVDANDALAARGFRVIAVALRSSEQTLQTLAPEQLEADLVLVGLIGLYDPPRPEVPEAIRQCRQAGIKVTMVTGDYGLTAQAIARQIGLLEPPASDTGTHNGHTTETGADPVRVIEGSMLSQISDVHLRRLLKYRSRLVFARMAPEQKLRLVQAYRDLGEVVAVTGDGVNDAPALRAADVGLAMGRNGTDVAREAADIVLLDDNFATIVEAVRFGRGVVSNIRKFITYILVANLSEAMPFMAMVAFRIPAALTVMQILAVDLGTDVLPALGLGAELPEPGLMHQPPRPRQAPLLDGGVMRRSYLFLGLLEAGFSMLAYLLVWRQAGVGFAELQALTPQLLHHTAPAALQAVQVRASSVAFTTIVLGQVGVLLACRSEWRFAWRMLRDPNPLLWFGIASELLLVAALVLVPALGAMFTMAPFPARFLPWMALAPVVIVLADDLRKLRLNHPSRPAAWRSRVR
jgi:Ca2+-transporting ATPase